MSDFSFLAIPNIEGMRVVRYIKVVWSVLLFGVCLFFVLYFWISYRKGKQLFRQLDSYDQRAQVLERDLVLQKIRKSSGKDLLILFIDYLERFVTSKHYANISELLVSQWFTAKEADEFAEIVYTDKPLPKDLEHKIHHYFTR